MKVGKIFILSIFIVLFACTKDKQHPVPYYTFDATINLNLPAYADLQNVGSGWAYVPDLGSKGVVVYRKSIGEFVAFDRQSPTDSGIDCETGLTVDSDNFLILNDPCSDQQFSLYDGSPMDKDAKWGLRQYEAEFNGDNILRIYNP